jgi:hypothetical protein
MKNKLTELKNNAPEIPTDTCPYINFIQETIKEIEDEINSAFIAKKLNLMEEVLEYIRESNEALRDSSHYWYLKCSNLIK